MLVVDRVLKRVFLTIGSHVSQEDTTVCTMALEDGCNNQCDVLHLGNVPGVRHIEVHDGDESRMVVAFTFKLTER